MKSSTLHWRDGAWVAPDDLVPSPQLILVFGAGDVLRHAAARAELRSRFPGAEIAGCSTAGEIAGRVVSDGGAVALAVEFGSTRVRGVSQRISQVQDSERVGEELAASLRADDLAHVLILSDGLQVNGAALARGLRAGLPAAVSATGGLAGDGPRFAETTVLYGDEASTGLVVAIGLYGSNLEVRWGSAGGWEAFGPKRLVTRAEDNVLFELDGQPALALYKTYLGDRADGLPATGLLFPLELLPETDAEPSVVRTILAMDEAAQSLTFAGDVPEGRQVRLMKSTIDKLIWGAEQAAEVVEPTCPVEVALLVSCVGRRLLLDQRVEEEIEAVMTELGNPRGAVGFYSYGEIGPAGLAHGCNLHNQTMTLTTLAERSI
ncbi:FIST signal transduction protein [Synoicihabitans lomoniglobus]|uniref:FIST N-terminal domain-containing protein n=1 Tax=Synoicihabitans lomoniglobus TaxID=2909285 RepID=A0AAE9ZX11_9BACT|nr:FIST C-terminal domain-containing protein [Opitutaceae bacterium LMO-M01]WED64649.1 FIST N-terminal domain-containing protein [Opitutaceae bacterium LMO-M01]